jgi:hypothetical protein
MKLTDNKPAPSMEAILEGMRRAVNKVIEEAKRDDRELVISRDGKVVKVKARDL